MPDSATFSDRSNAKRAAEKAILNCTAPSIDYKLHAREDGRIEILWQTGEADNAEKAEQTEHVEVEDDFGPDPWPPGTRVQVLLSRRRVRSGTVDYQVDPKYWRVFLDGEPPVSGMYRGDQLSAPDDNVLESAPTKKERPARTVAGRPSSKSAELDSAASRGIMPDKPVMTSKANAHIYQPRFNFLAERAAVGDWNAVRSYQVKGINSYAKMVKRYRDRLLAAHAALTAGVSDAA